MGWKQPGGYFALHVSFAHITPSLLLPRDPEHPSMRVHDVMRRYLIQRVGNQLPTLHQHLLDAHWQHYHLTRWADLPQSEAYLWQRLVFHLCEAGNLEALQTTLMDLWYVTCAVQYRGVAALEADLVLATTFSFEKGTGNLSPDLALLHQRIGSIHHLLQRVSNEAEIGGLVLCALYEEATLLPQRQALEQSLPRPFLAIWHPLLHTSSSALRTLSGHIREVYACAFSSDGKRIVSASNDRTLKVWDIATGAEVRTLSGHTSGVYGCAFSPDGKWVVSAAADDTLKVWDSVTGVERLTLRGHTDIVYGCAVSPNGRWIVSASYDQTLRVWEAATGAAVRTLRGHSKGVNDCGFSPDGKWIVSASYDQTLKVWGAATGAEVCILRGHSEGVNGCAFSPDGKWIVSASWDKTLKVWDSATGAEVRTLSGHSEGINDCGFSPDGKWIASASRDCTLKLWDSLTGAELGTLTGHASFVNACVFSLDGKWIVSASHDSTLKVWKVQSGQCVLTYPVDGYLYDCAFHPDGEHLVACGVSGMMYFLHLVQ